MFVLEIIAVPDFLYVIRCGDYFKVGRATNPDKRLGVIKSSSPYDVELLVVYDIPYPGIARAEETAHRLLAAHHHRGEWFRCDQAIALEAVNRAFVHAKEYVATEFGRERLQERYIENIRRGMRPALARKAEDIYQQGIWSPRTAMRRERNGTFTPIPRDVS